jgi:hypothetical protein
VFAVAEAGMEFFEDVGREAANFAVTFHTLCSVEGPDAGRGGSPDFCCAAKAMAGD